MRLTKHHGLGNDFLIGLDGRAGPSLVIDGDLARRVCDRRRGIGADGLIHGARPTAEQAAAGIDVVMHLFNSDGSRAEISGNGIRCLAQAVALHQGIVDGTIQALTDAGPRPLVVTPTDDPATVSVAVGMGAPQPGPRVPGPVEEFIVSRHATVDMGNPHLVILVPDPQVVDLGTEGPWLERQFPHGINIEYVAVEGRDALRLRVWERGAGITEACGTGACAAVHAAYHLGEVDRRVAVAMPGGDAEVMIEDDGTVTLRGPSTFVGAIDLPTSSDETTGPDQLLSVEA